MHSDAELAEMMSGRGIRPSVQRIAILKYVQEHKNHPTADTVFSALSPLYPTLSKTTVYNTLHMLSTIGLLNTLKIEEDELRYDADLSPHIHFKCIKCGRVFDISSGEAEKMYGKGIELLPQGFKAEHCEMSIWGTCSSCASGTDTSATN